MYDVNLSFAKYRSKKIQITIKQYVLDLSKLFKIKL